MVPMVLSLFLLLLNFFGILNPANRQIMNALDGKLSGSVRWNSERWGRCFGDGQPPKRREKGKTSCCLPWESLLEYLNIGFSIPYDGTIITVLRIFVKRFSKTDCKLCHYVLYCFQKEGIL